MTVKLYKHIIKIEYLSRLLGSIVKIWLIKCINSVDSLGVLCINLEMFVAYIRRSTRKVRFFGNLKKGIRAFVLFVAMVAKA